MSLDYPNRNDWLAVRYTPAKLNHGVTVWGKGTYAPGNNARKRAARAKAALHRRESVARALSRGFQAPKHRFAAR